MSTSIIHLRDLRNRRGVFEVDRGVVDETLRGDPEAMAAWNAVFRNMIVVHAEHWFSASTFRYVGYNPDFEVVPEGRESTRYEAIISRTTGPDGIVTFTATWQKL